MKHLPDILALQRNLVKRFQNVAELTGTIGEFLNAQNTGTETASEMSPVRNGRGNVSCSYVTPLTSFVWAGGLKAWYNKSVGIFLTTWNQLRVSLATNGKYQRLCSGGGRTLTQHPHLTFFPV